MLLNHKQRVILNISGSIYETFEETLQRFPNTLLATKSKRQHYFCTHTKQYFFDRNRTCFEAILCFYQSSGTLKCPNGISAKVFEEECRFFRLDEDQISAMTEREGIFTKLYKGNPVLKDPPFRIQVRNIIENPSTSNMAWMYGMFSLVIVFLSIILTTLETIVVNSEGTWSIVEISLSAWFLLEFTIRMLFSEDKLHFIKKFMNLVDAISITPCVVHIFNIPEHAGVMGVLKTLKFMRVIRLLRFAKHSKRLDITLAILKASVEDILLLILCLLMTTVLGGALMYFAELSSSQPNVFTSIPASLWWSVQTVSSVGYGDMIPGSARGKLFGIVFMFVGSITISFPVVRLVTQFVTLYPKNVEFARMTHEFGD